MQRILLAAAAVAVLASPAYAQRDFDYIKHVGTGSTQGTITAVTALGVTVDQGAKGETTVPANTIAFIQYLDEPSELTQARGQVTRGDYGEAVKHLKEVELAADARPELAQDLEYYMAFSACKLAGSGTTNPTTAYMMMSAFVTKNTSSYHYLEANEVIAELLASMGRFDLAQKHYDTMAKAPWPEYKVHAMILVGRNLQAQKAYDKALAIFDKALAAAKTIKEGEAQVLEATVGRADCLVQTGKAAEAIPVLQKVIEQAAPEAGEVYARAYNALGAAHKQMKQPKEAVLAYLHVHVLFSAVPDAHAEALANLVGLWKEIEQGGRSKEAAELLQEQYPNSRWAKAVATPAAG